MNEYERYNKESGLGENRELEIDAIKDYFGSRLLNISPINDKERQVKGIDYIVTIDDNNGGKRTLNIDTKIHHFDSELFVFEYDDTRENYKNRTWTNGEKETDIVFWIMPANNKYCVYSESALLEFIQSEKWICHPHEEFMDTPHYDKYGNFLGKTINKWLPLNFSLEVKKRYVTKSFDMSCYKCEIKKSSYKYDAFSQTYVKCTN